jgi:hypothetical protein
MSALAASCGVEKEVWFAGWVELDFAAGGFAAAVVCAFEEDAAKLTVISAASNTPLIA